MKAINVIVKILVALAAVAGAVYVFATYGEQIAQWAKKMLSALPCKKDCECACDCDCEECDCTCDCEDCECEDAPAQEEIPAEEAPADAVLAEDNDFEG